jgi:DNA-binding beta-propeller fold protein YncE
MVRNKIRTVVALCLVACACKQKEKSPAPATGNYPKEVAEIILNKCAVSGCHNDLSYINASGLNLSTWDTLFSGGYSGAVVIPYRPDFSSLCFFTNTFTDLGVIALPTMPIGSDPLTRAEYILLRNWIASGAPSAAGKVKFAENPSRKKFYVTNRLCNVVTVIDAVSVTQMRYVDVGGHGGAAFPYAIKTSPDRKHWYVSFYSQTSFIQKFNAETDEPEADLELGPGVWTSFAITGNSRYGWFVDNSGTGKIAYADLQNNILLATHTFDGKLQYPFGIALSESLQKLYVGATSGNYVYCINIADPLHPTMTELPIDKSGLVQRQSSLDPVELLTDAQNGRCFIACAASHDIRIVDMASDILIGTVPLGEVPASMAFSGKAQLLFVSCPDDRTSFPGNRGAVIVTDPAKLSIVKRIESGYQPYGIAIDDERNIAAIVNANISSDGPASHHETGCGVKNGNVTFVDLTTLDLIPGKNLELAVFPYGACFR